MLKHGPKPISSLMLSDDSMSDVIDALDKLQRVNFVSLDNDTASLTQSGRLVIEKASPS